jgi:hypothetical protein
MFLGSCAFHDNILVVEMVLYRIKAYWLHKFPCIFYGSRFIEQYCPFVFLSVARIVSRSGNLVRFIDLGPIL